MYTPHFSKTLYPIQILTSFIKTHEMAKDEQTASRPVGIEANRDAITKLHSA